MRRRQFFAIPVLALAAACSPFGGGYRGTPKPVMPRSYDLRALRFSAKPGLTVSEEESFYPNADIVWRGDPVGPRIPQIESMFQAAVARNQSVLTGSRTVDVVVTLVRFHGVTERTRTTLGGVYNIVFELSVRDARSGAVIEPPRLVVANLNAPGGATGMVLGDEGQTQRARVISFLTGILRQELV